MMRIASIGECMIELRQMPGGHLTRSFGGDTLNTAVYLARLGARIDYITALGDDPLSDEMIAGWQDERIGTGQVLRLKGKLPGLYMIETNAAGERRFYHWRDASAVRGLMSLPETDALLASLAGYDMVYLSAITLSLFDMAGRERLIAALQLCRDRGVRVAFDTNFRARGWPDLDLARDAFGQAFAASDIVLASVEDLSALYPDDGEDALLDRIDADEVVLKLATPASIVRTNDKATRIEAQPVTGTVVDTTAAGDSFAAAYLHARLSGSDPVASAKAGHHLAGTVVCHPGAIIPREAMPDMRESTS
ncbi:sugar kinase [Tardiphaga alba]|uniref:Sugar kinase n=1 Tax=Tardiphaga alba TaxID=340268 RepID=A0ABX8A9T5_9BRAD|nr:sugar kinase [Tardiphaga alba]QUS39424.1 sugar kinase [Tardiphaga alba]